MLINMIILSWILSFTFTFMIHPLSLGFVLLLQTTMMSLVLGNLNIDFWFSYIFFLIMIGGMLVLFIYMTSIASDEKFKFSKNLSILYLFFLLFIMFSLFSDQFFSNLETLNLNLMNNLNSNLSMSKFTSSPSWMIFFILIWYLLITLIVTVKIAYKKNGTLRPWMS